jgi:hypothetical protein
LETIGGFVVPETVPLGEGCATHCQGDDEARFEAVNSVHWFPVLLSANRKRDAINKQPGGQRPLLNA